MYSADQIASALGLKKKGKAYRGACPVHGGSSFEVRDKDGTTLFYCFSGCDQGDVLKALQGMSLWQKPEQSKRPPPPIPIPKIGGRIDYDRIEWAERFVLICAQFLHDGKGFDQGDLDLLPEAVRLVRNFSRAYSTSINASRPTAARQALAELKPVLDAISICQLVERYESEGLRIPEPVINKHIDGLRLLSGRAEPTDAIPAEAIHDIKESIFWSTVDV